MISRELKALGDCLEMLIEKRPGRRRTKGSVDIGGQNCNQHGDLEELGTHRAVGTPWGSSCSSWSDSLSPGVAGCGLGESPQYALGGGFWFSAACWFG